MRDVKINRVLGDFIGLGDLTAYTLLVVSLFLLPYELFLFLLVLVLLQSQ